MTPCPVEFPASYYRYGQRQHSPGRTPQWLERLSENGDILELSAEELQEDSAMEEVTDTRPSDDNPMAGESRLEDQLDQVTGIETDPNRTGNRSTKSSVDENPRRKTPYSLRTTRKPPSRYKDAIRDKL